MRPIFQSLIILTLVSVVGRECLAQQTNIQQMALTTCSVMAGQRQSDGRSMQYLLMLNDADNPISEAFTQEVIRQCPRTYIEFMQRTRRNNPYPPGSLLK